MYKVVKFVKTSKMVPICLRASSFPKSMSNNKHEQIQNQNAIALPHSLVSNRNFFLYVCRSNSLFNAKVSVSNFFRGLFHVNKKRRKVLGVCVVSTIEF